MLPRCGCAWPCIQGSRCEYQLLAGEEAEKTCFCLALSDLQSAVLASAWPWILRVAFSCTSLCTAQPRPCGLAARYATLVLE